MNVLSAQRVTTVIAALAAFGATAWWAAHDHESRAGHGESQTHASAPESRDSHWPQGLAEPAAAPSALAENAVQEAESASEASLRDYVAGKYQFILEDAARPPRAAHELLGALLARERIAVQINTARQGSDTAARESLPRLRAELAELDRGMSARLRPADFAAFEVLRDSDIEQFQLDDYAGGVSNVAPLSEAERQSILYTKLLYRQRFRQVLDDSGLLRGELGAQERRYAFAEVSRALENSKESFLQEARQYLYNDEQYALLRNYETSEYDAELAKLRTIAYGD